MTRIGANMTRIGANTTRIGADMTRIGANKTRIGANMTRIGANLTLTMMKQTTILATIHKERQQTDRDKYPPDCLQQTCDALFSFALFESD